MEAEDDDLSKISDPWRDDSVTLSLFGYYGTATIDIDADNALMASSDDFSSEEDDRFWRIGPGILWRTGDLQLGGGYIFGKNENPFGAVSSGGSSVDSQSWFVEANYFAKPWLIPYVRYEELEFSNLPAEVTTDSEASFPRGADRSRFVVGAKMLLRANVTLGLEGIFYTKDDRESSNDDNSQFIASLRMAF
jgi:predicted porin